MHWPALVLLVTLPILAAATAVGFALLMPKPPPTELELVLARFQAQILAVQAAFREALAPAIASLNASLGAFVDEWDRRPR